MNISFQWGVKDGKQFNRIISEEMESFKISRSLTKTKNESELGVFTGVFSESSDPIDVSFYYGDYVTIISFSQTTVLDKDFVLKIQERVDKVRKWVASKDSYKSVEIEVI